MKVLLDGQEIEKPTNRGKFSPDRDVFSRIHRQRYSQWQMGLSLEDIAQEEGVTYNAIRHSVLWCEARMPSTQVLEGRNTRHKLMAITRLGCKCIDTLESLLGHEDPHVRLKAAEQIRKVMAVDQGNAVQVNTQVNVAQNKSEQVWDFESSIAKIREAQKAVLPELPPLRTTAEDEEHDDRKI